MAFFLTPRFAPAYQQASCSPFGGCAPRQRVSRPSFSLNPWLSQVDELLSDINREAQLNAQREAHRQRQQRKRAFRARFDVREQAEGYQVEGDVPGFERENLDITVTDEYTLKVIGNTQESKTAEAAPAPSETQAVEDKMNEVTLNETETETENPDLPARAATPASESGSNKSYQATVEDDFEDLGAETSSTVSANTEPKELKGKEKAVDKTTETAVQQQPQGETPDQQRSESHEWLSERVHGSFERTFQFPERIDANNVRAALRNGVLSINVPKAPAPAVRQITIQ